MSEIDKAMTPEQAAEYIQDSLDGCGDSLDEEAITAYEMGADALREKAEREKGCNFCRIELDDYPYVRAVGDDCESDECYEPVYCPVCGRRLK